MATFKKFALVLAVTSCYFAQQASSSQIHPLHSAPQDVESVVHEDGGFSMRLTKQAIERERTHFENQQIRQQRASNERFRKKMIAKQGWSGKVLSWFGLYGAVITEAEMPALNWYDETYTFMMTVDETGSKIQVVPDTALGPFVIETTTCTACATGKVDPAGGNAGIAATSTAVTGNLASSTYSGVEGTATVCIMKDGAYSTSPTSANIATMPCIENAKVQFANEVSSPNKNANAYLGLALGGGGDRYGNQFAEDQFLLNQFKTAGKLTFGSKQVGMALFTDDGNGNDITKTQSFLDVGTSSSGTVTKPNQRGRIITFDEDSFYWKTSLNGIWFGSGDSWKYGLNDKTVTIETGLQCLYVDDGDFDFIMEKITAYSTGFWQTADGETLVSCGDARNMQKLSILVNNYWIEISPSDYLTPVRTEFATKEVSTGMCRICIKKSWDTFWHIGTSALVGYYAQFNLSRRTLGLYPLASGPKVEAIEGSRPDLVLGNDLLTISFLTAGNVIALGLLIALIVLAFFNDAPTPTNEEDGEQEGDSAQGPADSAFEQENDEQVTQIEDFDFNEDERIEIFNKGSAKVGTDNLEHLLKNALAKKGVNM